MIEANYFIAEYEFEETQVGPAPFRVRAIDIDGNIDPTPANLNWTILGTIDDQSPMDLPSSRAKW